MSMIGFLLHSWISLLLNMLFIPTGMSWRRWRVLSMMLSSSLDIILLSSTTSRCFRSSPVKKSAFLMSLFISSITYSQSPSSLQCRTRQSHQQTERTCAATYTREFRCSGPFKRWRVSVLFVRSAVNVNPKVSNQEYDMIYILLVPVLDSDWSSTVFQSNKHCKK